MRQREVDDFFMAKEDKKGFIKRTTKPVVGGEKKKDGGKEAITRKRIRKSVGDRAERKTVAVSEEMPSGGVSAGVGEEKIVVATEEKFVEERDRTDGSQPEGSTSKKLERYFEAIGRRKTATARVRLYTRAGEFTVNDKGYAVYFSMPKLQKVVEESSRKMKLFGRFRISAKVSGGGIHAQAEAIRHGLARCLVKFNPDFRKRLRRAGFLTRDPRAKERKKFGLKKARRAPQWQKR